MTTLYQDLQTLGLSPNQATVYLALARLGPSKASAIIKRTGMHRNLVYVALQELIERELVASNEVNGISVFKTLSFTRLLAEPQEQQRLAKCIAEAMGRIARHSTSNQEIVVREGIDELQKYLVRTFDTAPRESTVRYLGFSPRWNDVIDSDSENDLIRKQIEKKIHIKAIAASASDAQRRYVKRTRELSELKISPVVSNETNEIEMLDDRVSIRLFTPPYFVVEIVNEELAKNYQSFFDSLWRQKFVR